MSEVIARHVTPRVVEALEDTRIVVLQGARQVGKTTLVRELVDDRGGRLLTLDDPATLARAAADPLGFLLEEPERLLAIDEVQRLPELILPLKYVVDRDTRPGRFLLTGSANLLRLPSMPDSFEGITRSAAPGFWGSRWMSAMWSNSASRSAGCSGSIRTLTMPSHAASRCGFITPSPQITITSLGCCATSFAASGNKSRPCLPPSVPENNATTASSGMSSSDRYRWGPV